MQNDAVPNRRHVPSTAGRHRRNQARACRGLRQSRSEARCDHFLVICSIPGPTTRQSTGSGARWQTQRAGHAAVERHHSRWRFLTNGVCRRQPFGPGSIARGLGPAEVIVASPVQLLCVRMVAVAVAMNSRPWQIWREEPAIAFANHNMSPQATAPRCGFRISGVDNVMRIDNSVRVSSTTRADE